MTFKVPFQVKQFCVFQCLIYAASAAEGAENKKRFKKKKKKVRQEGNPIALCIILTQISGEMENLLATNMPSGV